MPLQPSWVTRGRHAVGVAVLQLERYADEHLDVSKAIHDLGKVILDGGEADGVARRSAGCQVTAFGQVQRRLV